MPTTKPNPILIQLFHYSTKSIETRLGLGLNIQEVGIEKVGTSWISNCGLNFRSWAYFVGVVLDKLAGSLRGLRSNTYYFLTIFIVFYYSMALKNLNPTKNKTNKHGIIQKKKIQTWKYLPTILNLETYRRPCSR